MAEQQAVGEAYARGYVRFMGLEILVASGTLVPRAETELLGSRALQALREIDASAPRIIDMCGGAGNLACLLAHLIETATVWASDLTPDCTALAARNVAAHGLGARVAVHEGDLFAPLAGLGLEGSVDLIVCNPPYISDRRLAGDRAHLLELEPREAFAAGPYGISIYTRVVLDAVPFLRPGGSLIFEIGAGQDRQVRLIFERAQAYDRIDVARNAAGEARVVYGRRRG